MSIDFTARLFGISQYEAAKRLIEDFRLDIHIENKGKRRRIGNRAPLKIQKPKVVLIREKLEQWLNYCDRCADSISEVDSVLEENFINQTQKKNGMNYLRRHWQTKEE